jgi:ornithine carbamoyltransferase
MEPDHLLSCADSISSIHSKYRENHMRHCLELTDFSINELREILALAGEIKAEVGRGEFRKPFANKSFACIFHKASLRTRISFEVGLTQLGGQTLYITEKEIELGKRESVSDVAKVLSRYVDGILIRTFSHDSIVELSQHADVPIVNMLTDLTHPCQVLADIFTVLEHRGSIDNLVVTYLGDGNNMTNSWLNLARRLPMELRIATSPDCMPDPAILKAAQEEGLSKIVVTSDPRAAAKGADVLYTDVWASMGQKDQADSKAETLRSYQINSDLLSLAKPDCLVMHCLPAERGKEITDEVMDGPNSVVFDEAENRMHAQKALLVKLIEWSA